MRRVLASIFFVAVTLFCVSHAAAEVPADLGKSETRCDAKGCALGPCVARDMWADPLRIINTARIIPNVRDGDPQGFRLYAIRPGTFLHKLGLENGDIIMSANHNALNSPASALSAFEALANATDIMLEVLRGKNLVLRHIHIDRRPLQKDACPPPPPLAPGPPVPSQSTSPSVTPTATTESEALRELDKSISCTGNRCKLKKGAVDLILAQSNLFLTSARIVPAMKDGKAIGLKLFAIRPGSLLARLQLRNGDLLRKILGNDLTSPEKALETYANLRTADSIPVELERAGKPLTLTYQLEH